MREACIETGVVLAGTAGALDKVHALFGLQRTPVVDGWVLPAWTPYTKDSPMSMELGEHIGMMRVERGSRVELRKDFLLNG